MGVYMCVPGCMGVCMCVPGCMGVYMCTEKIKLLKLVTKSSNVTSFALSK